MSPVSTLIASLPDEVSTKVRKCVELSDTAVTPTNDAAPAVRLPLFTHLVSVPSDERT